MKKAGKICLAALAALIIIGLATVIILSLTLASMIRSGIVTVLPKITGTTVSLENFEFSLWSGRVRMRNFIIGNPEGYNTAHAFRLGELVVDLKVSSLAGKKIVIEEILIDRAEITCETTLRESNLSIIKGNIDNYCRNLKAKPKAQAEGDADSGKPAKKYQLDRFDCRNSSVTVGVKMLKNASASVTLPDVHLEGIGRDSEDGATLGEVAGVISRAWFDSIMAAVREENPGQVIDKARDTLDRVKSLF